MYSAKRLAVVSANMSSPLSAVTTEQLAPWMPWPAEVRESSLRTMRLNPPKQFKPRFDWVVGWIAQTFDEKLKKQQQPDGKKKKQKPHNKINYDTGRPSVLTQDAMALLLLRLLLKQKQKQQRQQPHSHQHQEDIVGDLVEVYFRLSPKRRDWTVVSVARWCYQTLRDAREHERFLGLLDENHDDDGYHSMTTLAAILRDLQACWRQASAAALAFTEFWKVWDTVSPIFVIANPDDDDEEEESSSLYRFPAIGAASDKNMGILRTNKKKNDPTHDILVLAWKMSCLVPTTTSTTSANDDETASHYHHQLRPTAAFALLLGMGYWNRTTTNDDEDDDNNNEETGASPRTTPGGRVVVPRVSDNAFLTWLVDAVQRPMPTTRVPPASFPKDKPTKRMTVQDVQTAMQQLLRDFAPELAKMGIPALRSRLPPANIDHYQAPVAMDTASPHTEKSVASLHETSTTTTKTPANKKAVSSSWLQELQDVMDETNYVTPTVLHDKLAVLLFIMCHRYLRQEQPLCDHTRLVNYYLETGRNPAAAMQHTGLPPYYYPQPQQPPAAGAAAFGKAGAPNVYGMAAQQSSRASQPAAEAQKLSQQQQMAYLERYPRAGRLPYIPNKRKEEDDDDGEAVVVAAPVAETATPPAKKKQKPPEKQPPKPPFEPDQQKKVDVSMTPSELATAMELAVVETKKLDGSFTKNDAVSTAHSVTPPVVTETMELTEWSVSLFCIEFVKPSKKLLKYLRAGSDKNEHWEDVLIPILNRALLRLAQEGLAEKPPRAAPVSVSNEKVPGLVQIHGDVTADKQLGKAVIALYYHALEAVLFVESERLRTQSHPQIVLYPVFHRAIMACCVWCVTKAVGVTQKLRASPALQAIQIHSTLAVTDTNPYDFLKVSESFLRSLSSDTARGQLGSPLIFGLPRILQKDLKQIEMNVADSLLWIHDPKMAAGSLPSQIEDFRGKTEKNPAVTLWPPEVLERTLQEEQEDREEGSVVPEYKVPATDHEDYAEYRCVNFMIRKVIKMAYYRIDALCRFLAVPPEIPFATQAWVAFRYLVRNRVELLFDRHIDQWILCCLYGVGKALKYSPELTFANIIQAYVVVRGPELGDVTCQRIVRHIKITGDLKDPGNADNIIALYNRVFVPEMRAHLLGSKSLKRSAAELPTLMENLTDATTY